MFAVILENATYKELYLLRYYLSESTPQWFKQGRPRYNTNYYRQEKPHSSDRYISESDITRYYAKPVSTVKQVSPNSKYQFENVRPYNTNENFPPTYFSNTDSVVETPKYQRSTQSLAPTISSSSQSASAMTPTATSITNGPVILPSSDNSKTFQQFERPVAVGTTPTAMTISSSADEGFTTSSPSTVVSTTNSVSLTKMELDENETFVDESIVHFDTSGSQEDFEISDISQVDLNDSANDFESSGEIIFDQFYLDQSQIHLSSINVSNDDKTDQVGDLDQDSELADEGSGYGDATNSQGQSDSITSQTFPTTVFLTTTNDATTKSLEAILPSQRVNEAAYDGDNITSTQPTEENLDMNENSSQADGDNKQNQTENEGTSETSVETNESFNNKSIANNSDINEATTETQTIAATTEVTVEDKDQLSSEILDYDSTVISCQDQRNSDSSKNEYFRPLLKCVNGGVIQIEYAYYGRFNSDTCARGKTESNQAWYWPTCGRKFKVKFRSLYWQDRSGGSKITNRPVTVLINFIISSIIILGSN